MNCSLDGISSHVKWCVFKSEAEENTKKMLELFVLMKDSPEKYLRFFSWKCLKFHWHHQQWALRGEIKAFKAHLKSHLWAAVNFLLKRIEVDSTHGDDCCYLFELKQINEAFKRFFLGVNHLNVISSARVRRRDKVFLWYFFIVTSLTRQDF